MSHKGSKTRQGSFNPYDVDWSDGKTPVPGDGKTPVPGGGPTLPETGGPVTVSMGAVVPREVCSLCGAPLGTCAAGGPAPTGGEVLGLKAWADAQPGTGVVMGLVLPDIIPHDGEADDE